MSTVYRYAEPTIEPVSTADMKLHLRVDTTADDLYITGLVRLARQYIEDLCGVTMLTTTWELVLQAFPSSSEILLPMAPVQSVTSVKYTPYGSSEATFSSANYAVDTLSMRPKIALIKTASWPGDELTTLNGVKVRYVAGYSSVAAVPEQLKHAVRLLTGHFYENREQVTVSNEVAKEIPIGIYALVNSFRVW